MKVLIVIPAYNEAESIEKVVDELIYHYPQYDYVIVNDGSRDSTENICRKKSYNVINLCINIGLAGAMQIGFKYASERNYDVVLQFDGDGQHRAEYIGKMLDVMRSSSPCADIVIGSRYLGGGDVKSMRRIGSLILSKLIQITTGKKITDPTSGMRLFNRSMINEFAYNMNYGPEPDTIAYLLNNAANIEEVQITMNERITGETYLNATRALKYMIHMVLSIFFIQWFRRRDKVSQR